MRCTVSNLNASPNAEFFRCWAAHWGFHVLCYFFHLWFELMRIHILVSLFGWKAKKDKCLLRYTWTMSIEHSIWKKRKRTKIKPYVFFIWILDISEYKVELIPLFFCQYSEMFLKKMKGSKMITIMSLAHNEMSFIFLLTFGFHLTPIVSLDLFLFFFSSFASPFSFSCSFNNVLFILYTNIVVNRTELHNFPAFVLIKQNDSCVCNKNILQAEYITKCIWTWLCP